MPYPKRKYRRGYLVHSISDLVYGLEHGQWYYWNDKVLHPGFFLSMQLRTIAEAIKNHIISEAIDQHKEYSGKQTEDYLATIRK